MQTYLATLQRSSQTANMHKKHVQNSNLHGISERKRTGQSSTRRLVADRAVSAPQRRRSSFMEPQKPKTRVIAKAAYIGTGGAHLYARRFLYDHGTKGRPQSAPARPTQRHTSTVNQPDNEADWLQPGLPRKLGNWERSFRHTRDTIGNLTTTSSSKKASKSRGLDCRASAAPSIRDDGYTSSVFKNMSILNLEEVRIMKEPERGTSVLARAEAAMKAAMKASPQRRVRNKPEPAQAPQASRAPRKSNAYCENTRQQSAALLKKSTSLQKGNESPRTPREGTHTQRTLDSTVVGYKSRKTSVITPNV